MKLLPYRRKKVADGMYVRLSQHFYYSDFGIVTSSDRSRYGRRYVNTGTPGIGFIERDSESYSYHRFVQSYMNRQRHTYWKLLTGQEPNFGRTIRQVREALVRESDPTKHAILDAYLNALTIGEMEEEVERIERGIKDKIGHRNHRKYYVSVLSHYKHKAHQLEKDMASVQLDVRQLCNEEQYAAYCRMVEAFARVAACRRVWNECEGRRERYEQVFFDLGVFDFIKSSCFLPLMRTARGEEYYILPTHIVVARGGADFDLLKLSEVTVVCQEMAIQEPIEVLNSKLGDAASMLRIPQLRQTWYFNHVHPLVDFVRAYDELKQIQ